LKTEKGLSSVFGVGTISNQSAPSVSNPYLRRPDSVRIVVMGISLEGQGRILEAAMAYRAGWIADPFDSRSFHHLRSLISKHKEYEHVLPRNKHDFIMERKKFIESHGGTYDISSLE
jgi:hypothetical protein